MQNITAVISASLEQQKARVELASYKLAMSESRFASKDELLNFVSQLEVGTSGLINSDQQITAADIREIKDANSPVKDADNNYFMLNVDPTHEMATLVSATRAYQSVVRAYNVSSEMNRTALTLGNNNS